MRISMFVAVALAASSATSAQPRPDRSAPVPVERAQARNDRWVSLALPVSTRVGAESIPVGRQAGAFRSLRIDAVSGAVQLRSLRVEFSNGRMATFYVARRLDRHRPHAYIDFNAPRFIDNIVVTTARKPEGSYAVFAAQMVVPGSDLIARD
jgi:hypothetical protein